MSRAPDGPSCLAFGLTCPRASCEVLIVSEKPLGKFIGARTVLAVRNLTVTRSFFRDKLGMEIEFEVPGWAFMARGAWRVMLGECVDAMAASETGDHSYVTYVTVEEIDALYREYSAQLVPMIQEVSDKPWGMREFGISTPDGHRIMFGQSMEA